MRLAIHRALSALLWLLMLPAYAQRAVGASGVASAASAPEHQATPGIPITWFVIGVALALIIGYLIGKSRGAAAPLSAPAPSAR